MIPLRDDIPSRGRPRVVRMLLVANVLGFLAQLLLGREFTERFALTPALLVDWWEGWRPLDGLFDAAFPLLSMQFLHGGPLHLASNLLFLWIFADNIEGELGHGPFLAFYLVCGIAAGLCHVAVAPESLIPTLGASGAISGVLGAYFVRFSHARILTLIPFFVIPLLVEIPALFFLGIWFALQLLRGLTGTAGMVAVWAHAGGFVAGLLLVFLFPRVRGGGRGRGPRPRYAIQGRPR